MHDPRHSDVSLVKMETVTERGLAPRWMAGAACRDDNSELFRQYAEDGSFDPSLMRPDRLGDLIETVVTERAVAGEETMDDRERYERGMSKRRKVLGNAWVDRANAGKTEFNAEFQDFITRYAWGEQWQRPHFDERTRRILVIGTMIGIDKWDEFRLHVRAALVEGGFSHDDIKEIILQQAIYCGVPAANHAFKEAAAVIAEIEKANG